MNTVSFADYVNEYEALGIGENLYQLVLHIVAKTVRFYPPSIYSPNGVWDEDAINGYCHDFIMQKLLRDGLLNYYLVSLDSVGGLRKALSRDFRHFLINKKTRTELTNLFQRLKIMLNKNAKFQQLGTSRKISSSIWGLVGWDEKEIEQQQEEIVKAMFKIDLPSIIRYRPDSKKLSPLIKNDNLLEVLSQTMLYLDRYIPFYLLFNGLRIRLGIMEHNLVSLDDPIIDNNGYAESSLSEVVPFDENTEGDLAINEIAHNIYDQLTDRQRKSLALYSSVNKLTLEEVGDQLGVSKSTANNDMAAIGRIIKDNLQEDDDEESILLLLVDLCSNHIANSNRMDN